MTSVTEILATDTPERLASAVARAADCLRQGGWVGLPTETVYGLAASARNAAAVEAVFLAKGRPARNPIIVHVVGVDMAKACVAAWPETAERLSRVFWPGPLTMVLPKAEWIPDRVTAGGGTVGVRWPSHPVFQAVIRACGFPLAAPSANRSNRLSPTTAAHVQAGLAGRVGLILDGGPCQVGLESTVVDLTPSTPRVLRPGMITSAALAAALNGEVVPDGPASPACWRSPGQMPRHYAPKARLVVCAWADEASLRLEAARLGFGPAVCHVVAYGRIPAGADWLRVGVVAPEPEAYARGLYAELHRGDEIGAQLILVERVPALPAWRGIHDRLARASMLPGSFTVDAADEATEDPRDAG